MNLIRRPGRNTKTHCLEKVSVRSAVEHYGSGSRPDGPGMKHGSGAQQQPAERQQMYTVYRSATSSGPGPVRDGQSSIKRRAAKHTPHQLPCNRRRVIGDLVPMSSSSPRRWCLELSISFASSPGPPLSSSSYVHSINVIVIVVVDVVE